MEQPQGEPWVEQAERALAVVLAAPEQYKALLLPLVLRAMSDASLRASVDVLTTDPFFTHLLAGETPEPFLPEPEGLAWVDKDERSPTEAGVYVTMNRMITSPCLLRLQGTLDRHWEWVTHWLGPIPVCETRRPSVSV